VPQAVSLVPLRQLPFWQQPLGQLPAVQTHCWLTQARLLAVQSKHVPLLPHAVSLIPSWQIPPAQQSAHGAQTPLAQLWQDGQLATHCPPLQQPLGQGCSFEQAVQTLFTQIGLGLLQPPQVTFASQLSSTTPQTPAVHGSFGVQPHSRGVPPPPQVRG
jgi:hypothetical protein